MESNAGIRDFKLYIDTDKNRCFGRNGYNDLVPFIPRLVLDNYWTPEKINNVLCDPAERISAPTEAIRQSYLIVFSVLAYLGRPQHITLFIGEALDDARLPHAAIPPAFSGMGESIRDFFDEFQKSQWKFIPLSFNMRTGPRPHRRRLSPYHIIPVMQKDRINRLTNTKVCVFKVKLHGQCFDETTVVFKVFGANDNDETTQQYQNEVDVYSQLSRGNAFDHITRYFGSFESAGLRTIMLEYANGGHLLSLFENYPPPHSQSDCEMFWNSLMKLFSGLEHLHNISESKKHSKGAWILKGTHQDIRPQNILVHKTSSGNMYDVTLKFVDLGTGDLRRTKHQGLDRDAKDQHGNGMYSAPEANQDDGDARGIRSYSDIWSLGGILSEAMVWCIWGEHGRSKYQASREKATRKTRLEEGYHIGAFYDGDCRLEVVEEWHRDTVNAAGDSVSWYDRLSNLILDQMLRPEPTDRSKASKILQEWFKTPTLATHKSEPIQLLPRLQTKTSEDTMPSRKDRKTLPDISKDVNRMGLHGIADNLPSIVVSPEQQPDDQSRFPDPQGVNRDDRTYRRKSLSRCPNCGPIEHPGPDEDSEALQGCDARNLRARKRAVSAADVDRIFTMRPDDDNESLASATTAVGEHSHQPTYRGASDAATCKAIDANQSEVSYSGKTGLRDSLSRHTSMTFSRSRNRWSMYQKMDSASSQPDSQISKRLESMPITIEMVWETCLEQKDQSLKSKLTRSNSAWRLFRTFPRLQEATDRLKGEEGRDQIFLVDDSMSMIYHQKAMAKTCRVLCYILKTGKVDPDSFELYFTSRKPGVVSTTSSRLQDAIREMVFTAKSCDMATSLDDLATKVIQNRKPVSIYVLTNGHWTNGSEQRFCGVDYSISRMVRHVRERNKQRNWIGVQFIRFFGKPPTRDDDIGRYRLQELDDELKEDVENDIVDTTDCDGDIYKILLGAISPEEDNADKRDESNSTSMKCH